MNEHTRTIRGDLAAAGLMPDAEHGVMGPGGESLSATTDRRLERAKRRMDPEQRDALFAGGMHLVYVKRHREDGMTAHRGVLHEDEYVDATALQALVEQELGFTYEQIRSVYRQGRLSDDQRELRGRIDARLLALSRAGGNLAELGRALGFKVERDSHCEPLDNAVARARKEES